MNNFVVLGDVLSEQTISNVKISSPVNGYHLIVADPPYGNVVSDRWDRTNHTQSQFTDWMFDWTKKYSEMLCDRGLFYIWGGIGTKGFRPFFEFCSRVEQETDLLIYNVITWKKRRAYGLSHNYLFTREELVVLIKSDDVKTPRKFNIPYLDKKRGYEGYNKKYPAKSEFYRRSNVWDDGELLRNKLHSCQKAPAVAKVPIEVHTDPGDTVLDLFSGSGETSYQAKLLGRSSVAVESDFDTYSKIVKRLNDG